MPNVISAANLFALQKEKRLTF